MPELPASIAHKVTLLSSLPLPNIPGYNLPEYATSANKFTLFSNACARSITLPKASCMRQVHAMQ